MGENGQTSYAEESFDSDFLPKFEVIVLSM